jgi:hypothetical protein
MKVYAMTVICAAFTLSLLSAIAPEGPGKGTRRLTGAVFLVLAALLPLGKAKLPELDLSRIVREGECATQDGREQYEAALSGCITDEVEAYILTKAAALGLEPEVEVILGEDDCPARIILTAAASPVERQSLTGTVVRELGLEKEKVTWIDPYQSSG